MRLLDRYIIRNFLQPYFYCILGFLSIWLIFDISDNSSIIFDERAPFLLVREVLLDPDPSGPGDSVAGFALLLALLFCLGRMSRSNEIVSMLTAGVSVPRVVLPLLAIGLLTTGAAFALNYSLAAHAELARKAVPRAGPEPEWTARRGDQRPGLPQPDRQPHLVYRAFSSGNESVQRRADRAAGRAGKYRPQLFCDRRLLRAGQRRTGGSKERKWSITTRRATSPKKNSSLP